MHVRAMREAFVGLGVDVVPLDESDAFRVETRLGALHAEEPIGILYERYAIGRPAGARFSRAHGVPLVLEVNAPLAHEEARYRSSLPDPAARARDQELFSAATLVIAVSHEVASYAVESGAAPQRVHVRPNAVDPERFRPRNAGDPLRDRLVPAGRFALGFHGRLRPWHNFDLFARATEELLVSGEPVHLVLVGEGDFDAALAGRVPAEHVARVPWVDHGEIGPYVATFDAVPLTYAPDTPCYFSPLKLAEAMACGAVPVLPQLGDLELSATHDVDALFYPPGDLGALVSALRVLIRDPERRARMSRSAVTRARARSWRDIAAFVLSAVGDRAPSP